MSPIAEPPRHRLGLGLALRLDPLPENDAAGRVGKLAAAGPSPTAATVVRMLLDMLNCGCHSSFKTAGTRPDPQAASPARPSASAANERTSRGWDRICSR